MAYVWRLPGRTMADTSEPAHNGLAEHFMRPLKEKLVDYADWTGFDDAYPVILNWLEVGYNTRRIQGLFHPDGSRCLKGKDDA